MNSENQYDPIAEVYKESKQLPFREFIEAYSLFKILGDIRGGRFWTWLAGTASTRAGSSRPEPWKSPASIFPGR